MRIPHLAPLPLLMLLLAAPGCGGGVEAAGLAKRAAHEPPAPLRQLSHLAEIGDTRVVAGRRLQVVYFHSDEPLRRVTARRRGELLLLALEIERSGNANLVVDCVELRVDLAGVARVRGEEQRTARTPAAPGSAAAQRVAAKCRDAPVLTATSG